MTIKLWVSKLVSLISKNLNFICSDKNKVKALFQIIEHKKSIDKLKETQAEIMNAAMGTVKVPKQVVSLATKRQMKSNMEKSSSSDEDTSSPEEHDSKRTI